MSYAKQTTSLFFLILFLQAFQLCKSGSKHFTPVAVSTQVADTELALEEPAKESHDFDPDLDPGFDAKIRFDRNFEPYFYSSSAYNAGSSTGYDSGYDSDSDSSSDSSSKSDAKLVPKEQPLPLSDLDNRTFDFESKIRLIREEADKARHIRWELVEDRLKREVGELKNSLYAVEDYIVQGLNIYRAANKIYKLYRKKFEILEKRQILEKDKTFESEAHRFLKHYFDFSEKPENYWSVQVKKINKEVVLHLQKTCFQQESHDSINAKLRLAENYVGLDDTHYDITTIFKIEGKKFGLEDKKWLTLTQKQQQAYRNRKSEKWYNRLSSFEQMFIDHYLDKFLDGKHYIPTQLRSLPGCRNAYQKRILFYDENNNPTVLGRYYHSGSLPSPIEWKDKETDWEITQDNWKQIQEKNKDIIITSLNYNMNLPGFNQIREKKIIEDTIKAVGKDQFMNLSINAIGTSSNLKEQYDRLVEDVISRYRGNYPELCKSLKEDQNFFDKILKKNKKASREKQIEKIQDLKDQAYFKKIEKLKEAAERSHLRNNVTQMANQNDNYYANIAADYIACKSVLGQFQPVSSVLFSCKSGKDRTGIMSYLVDGNIICMYHPSLDVTQVHKALACSGHYQFLASVNGGMPGRFGMKSVKESGICHSFKQQLFPGAAAYTHFH